MALHKNRAMIRRKIDDQRQLESELSVGSNRDPELNEWIPLADLHNFDELGTPLTDELEDWPEHQFEDWDWIDEQTSYLLDY